MSMYVNFLRNGLVYIPGESKAKEHEGWTEALSMQVRPPTISQPVDPSDGAPPPTPGELTIVKAIDSTSPRIAMAFHGGIDMEVVFDIVKSSNNNENLRYSATDVVIAQVVQSSNGAQATETVTVSFGKVVGGVIPGGPDVSNHLPPAMMGYDLAQVTVI